MEYILNSSSNVSFNFSRSKFLLGSKALSFLSFKLAKVVRVKVGQKEVRRCPPSLLDFPFRLMHYSYGYCGNIEYSKNADKFEL